MENKYSVYRKIKADRAYKTLGKMNWVRVVLGLILLLLVFFLSGSVSELLARRGAYTLAEKSMIYPSLMETYKPEEKAYIESGALLESGDYIGAYEKIIDVDPNQLPDKKKVVLSQICARLYEHFSDQGDAERCGNLDKLIKSCTIEE